jgi:starvation-inducible DNA-binding protein
MDNQALAERLKVVLATAHAFALKAQNYHWNVTGPHFVEYHKFFQEIYEQVHDDVDSYAEFIRILGMFAPGSLSRFSELSRVKDELSIPVASAMIDRLAKDNTTMIGLLKSMHSAATEAKNFALTSFIEERLQYHEKLAWMLASLLIST